MSGVIFRFAVLAVCGTVAALIIKRSNAELTAALSVAVCAIGLVSAMELVRPIVEVMEKAKDFSGLSWAVLSPVLKCIGISLTARIASDMCRDGGQSAMAETVELTGAVCALYTALPLVNSLLSMLEELS